MNNIIILAIGGTLGTVCRYLLVGLIGKGLNFPLGTFVVNLTGSFCIGILWEMFQASLVSQEIRLLLMVGFLGAFTTFSAFSLENMNLIKNGDIKLSLLYIFLSNLFAILFVFAGSALTRSFLK